MIKKNRDSKFIIYQVLYIFVVTVLALKGADLNLNRVVAKDEVVDKSVKDSLITLIDSLYAQGANFDIKIEEQEVKKQNQDLKEKLQSMKSQVASLTDKIKEIPPEERIPKKEEKPEPKEKTNEQTVLQSPISKEQTFIQYTWNEAKNTGNVPTTIYSPDNMSSPLAVIPPGETKRFNLTDQKEVVVKYGSQQQRVEVEPNQPPKVKIERATTKMNGSDIYVKDLQRVTGFNVTIVDERPEQLDVKYSGPISVNGPHKDTQGNLVYNVSLNLAPTESRYEKWVDQHDDLRESDGRYKANFFFTVVDKISKDRVQVGDSFFFTDYSR